MSAVICNPLMVLVPAQTGRVSPSVSGLTLGVFRLPTDPLFFADLTLENIVVGSRYRVTRTSTGEELATGVAASSTTVIVGLPCFANPMQVSITIRNASGAPYYRVFDTAAFLARTGATAYILQQQD